jgi:hypothetical protein
MREVGISHKGAQRKTKRTEEGRGGFRTEDCKGGGKVLQGKVGTELTELRNLRQEKHEGHEGGGWMGLMEWRECGEVF